MSVENCLANLEASLDESLLPQDYYLEFLSDVKVGDKATEVERYIAAARMQMHRLSQERQEVFDLLREQAPGVKAEKVKEKRKISRIRKGSKAAALWSIANEAQAIEDFARIQKNLGTKNLTPEQAQRILKHVVEENKEGLEGAELKAFDAMNKFMVKQDKEGDIHNRAEVREYPEELLDKDGKPLVGHAAKRAKITLIGGTASEVALQITKGVDTDAQYEELMENVRSAIENVGDEAELANYLENVMELPQPDIDVVINAVASGRAYLSTAAEVQTAAARETTTADLAKQTGYTTEVLDTIIDTVLKEPASSVDNTISSLRKALTDNGATTETANEFVQLLNNMRQDEQVTTGPTLFEQQDEFRKDAKTVEETYGTSMSMYQKISASLQNNGFTVPFADFNQDIVEARVDAGRFIAQMVEALHANKKAVPMSLVFSLITDRLHKEDPLRLVYQKVSKLGYGGIDFKSIQDQKYSDIIGTYTSSFNYKDSELYRAIEMSRAHTKDALGLEQSNRATAAFLTHTLAHEAVHVATATAIDFNPDVAKQVRALYNETIDAYRKDNINAGRVHGLLNEHEFIAEAFTNSMFQAELNKIKSKSSSKTLWDKFLDLIGSLLGLDVRKGSVLHEVVALTDDLFQNKAESDAYVKANRDAVRRFYEEDLLPSLEELKRPKFNPTDFKLKRDMHHKLDTYTAGAAGALTDMFQTGNVDTLQGVIGKFKDGAKASRTFALGMMMLDQLKSTYSKYFDGLSADGKANPLTETVRLWQKRQAEAKAFEVKNNYLITEGNQLHQKFPDEMRKMYDLAHQATMHQVHIDKPWSDASNAGAFKSQRTNKKTGKVSIVNRAGTEVARKAHAKAHAQFRSLPAKVRNMYTQMGAFYNDVHKQVRTKIIHNVAEQFNVTDLDTLVFTQRLFDADTNDKVDAVTKPDVLNKDGTTSTMSDEVFGVIAKTVKNLNAQTMNGPYFPLDRYGDYAFNASFTQDYSFASKEAAMDKKHELQVEVPGSKTSKVEKVAEGKYTFTHKGSAFIKRENMAEARKAQQEFVDMGYEVEPVGVLVQAPRGEDNFASQIAAIAERQLQRRAKDDPSYESARIAIREAMITLLPDTSIQRHMMKRKGVIGADMDMGRSLARYMKSAAWALANLDHISAINDSMHDLNNASQRARKAGKFTNDETILISQVANEMTKRNVSTVRRPSMAVEWAAKFGFFNYLFSVSYSVVNATQPALVALPWLTGKHGAKASTAALSRAYKLVAGRVASAAISNKFGFSAFGPNGIDIDGVVNQLRSHVRQGDNGVELDNMLAKLQEEDIIGATLTLEIAEEARGRGRRNKVSNAAHKMMEMGRTMPHLVEILNRSTTAIAAYELGRKKGMSKEQATIYARDAVVKTQFDYSEANRPRYFTKNDLLRVMTMFKIHPLGIYGFLIGNINAIKDPATRQESIRALSMLLATHAAFAGAAGSLLLEPIKVAMGMMAVAFGDEGDDWAEWFRDPEINARRMIFEATGNRTLSEAVVYGLPRLAGVDMHSRLGLQSLMLMHSKGDTAFETGLNTVTDSLLGPVLGVSRGYTTMAAAIANGQGLAKASEYALPKGVRDIMRSLRYLDEGMTDFNGNVILDSDKLSAKDLAVRAIGFSPSPEAEIYEGRTHKTRRVSRLRRKIRGLTNRWKNATPKERRELWLGDIKDFNEGLTREERRAFRVTRGMLQRSLSARKRRERDTKKGIHFTRKERALRKEYEFTNI